jgi:hypothetical protein
MNAPSVPDPWANKREINIDDGGGESFAGGYDTNTLTLSGFKVEVPNTVGCWRMNGNFHVHVTEKPNWFHRKMTKFLLGWIWVDS